MRLVRGDRLPPQARRDVLASYGYRWTHENAKRIGRCPACAQQAACGGAAEVNGTPWHEYHNPLVSDEQWLRDHAFYVTRLGALSRRHRHCEPGWMAEEGVNHA